MHRFAALVAVAIVTTKPPATAQEPDTSYAQRGPRFLLALADTPVPVDVARSPVLRQRISLDLHGVPLVEALRLVSKKSGVQLAFSNAVLPATRRIDFRADNITVVAALTEILLDAQVDILFSRDGRGVLVRKPAPRVTEALQQRPITGVVVNERGAAIAGANVAVVGSTLQTVTEGLGRFRLHAPTAPAGTL